MTSYCFEAARQDQSEKQFAALKDALDHIEGSASDRTRPWVRIKSLDAPDCIARSFLIVSGKKLNSVCLGSSFNPLTLSKEDQTTLNAWSDTPPNIKHLLAEIDLCNNGYARVDCLDRVSRTSILEAQSSGLVVLSPGPLGVNIVHRPELKIGVINVERERTQGFVGDEGDWGGAILERQEYDSLRG